MVTVVCSLVMSFQVYADTMRLPEKMPELLQLPRQSETPRHDVMPNAKPSFRSNMPVHRHDESKVIPMPNSVIPMPNLAAESETFQLQVEEVPPKDSSQRKKKP